MSPAETGKSAELLSKQRLRWILFCAAFASFMVNVNTYIVNISLPEIANYFSVTTGNVTFVVQAFQLSTTGLLLIVGKVGDGLGLRRVFTIGFVFFALACLLCGLSTSFYMLVGMRFIQGIAASILYALTPALIAAFYPVEERGPAFGIMAIFTALGMTLGTSIGGLLNDLFSWHGIFLFNVPFALLGAAVCWLVIPERGGRSSVKDLHADFDYQGALISMTALMALVAAAGYIDQLGLTSPFVLGGLTSFVLLSVWFMWHEQHTDTPLMDFQLLASPALGYGNLASVLAYMFMSGTNFLVPFYMKNSLGYSSSQAGMLFMIYPLLYMVIGPSAGYLSKRIHSRTICTVSMAVGAAAALFFALTLGMRETWPVVVFLIMQAFTFGGFTTSNNNVVMSLAPPGQESQVSGLYRMFMRIGLIIGLALFERLFSFGLGEFSAVYTQSAASIPNAVLDRAFSMTYVAGFLCCCGALFASRKAKSA